MKSSEVRNAKSEVRSPKQRGSFFPAASVLVCLALLATTGCKPAHEQTPSSAAPAPLNVRVVALTRGRIFRTIALPGSVVPYQQAALCAKVPGYLKSIAVDKGDAVKAGDLLAEIEAPELLADTAKFRADVEVAQIEYRRASEAQQKAADLVPAQAVDTARAKFLTAKASLDRAEVLLNFCKITAPFDGVITRRNADPGAFIPAGASAIAATNSAILVLTDFSTVRIQVAVPEREAPRMQRGIPATIGIDELPDLKMDATLTRQSNALDPETRTLLAEFDVPNPERRILPGMFVTARISVEKHDNALLAPLEAVLVEKSGASVFVVANGKAQKVAVTTGFNDGSQVELLSGAATDARVIALGKLTPANGQPVVVQE